MELLADESAFNEVVLMLEGFFGIVAEVDEIRDEVIVFAVGEGNKELGGAELADLAVTLTVQSLKSNNSTTLLRKGHPSLPIEFDGVTWKALVQFERGLVTIISDALIANGVCPMTISADFPDGKVASQSTT